MYILYINVFIFYSSNNMFALKFMLTRASTFITSVPKSWLNISKSLKMPRTMEHEKGLQKWIFIKVNTKNKRIMMLKGNCGTLENETRKETHISWRDKRLT